MIFQLYFFLSLFIYFEREREGIPSRLHIVNAEPDLGLEPMNRETMTQAETKSWTLNRLSHPGSPYLIIF